jgi:hypothetical protein
VGKGQVLDSNNTIAQGDTLDAVKPALDGISLQNACRNFCCQVSVNLQIFFYAGRNPGIPLSRE